MNKKEKKEQLSEIWKEREKREKMEDGVKEQTRVAERGKRKHFSRPVKIS